MKFIEKELNNYHLTDLLSLSGISRKAWYRWKSGATQNKRLIEDEQLKEKILIIWKISRENYGIPRIYLELLKAGVRTSRKRIGRLMRELGIKGRYNRRKKPQTTDSRHSERISKNLLKKRDFPDRAREVVVTDTTYIWTGSGWHYLATVMDLCTRQIIGWSFSEKNDQHLVCKALWNAAGKLKGAKKVLHHSDRGSTYCSESYRKLMKRLGLISSMSAKGYCYDNAYMESFFGTLKCECESLNELLIPEQARLAIFDYIEGFYNPQRIHTSLGGLSPNQYHDLVATPMGVMQG